MRLDAPIGDGRRDPPPCEFAGGDPVAGDELRSLRRQIVACADSEIALPIRTRQKARPDEVFPLMGEIREHMGVLRRGGEYLDRQSRAAIGLDLFDPRASVRICALYAG